VTLEELTARVRDEMRAELDQTRAELQQENDELVAGLMQMRAMLRSAQYELEVLRRLQAFAAQARDSFDALH
jgi:hypothetical protein